MTPPRESDIEITEEEAARGVELACRHSHFDNAGDQFSRCDCGWSYRGSQGACTQASRRHVQAHPSHRVLTTRTQTKVTYMRKVRVLR